MTEVAAVTTQTLTVGRDASGVVQLTGHHNTVYVFSADAGRERVPADNLAPPPDESRLGANPYRSLDAFDEESSELFFGRDGVTAELLTKLETLASADPENATTPRLLAVMGPSGSGKSSVARAGLIPEIVRSRLRGLQAAEVAILQPGRRPVEALAAVLARAITRDPAPVKKTEEFEDVIRGRATADTHDGLARIARARGRPGAPLIILVDQFEEVYTLVRSVDEKDAAAIAAARAERDTFVRTLLHAASEPGGSVFIVLTLRSDFYGAVTEHPEMSAAISANNKLIPAMIAADLTKAITEPAKRRGLDLPDAVVDRLVRQATDNPSALPLVQHALFRFWNTYAGSGADPDKQRAAYAILSDLGGAITATANEVMATLPSDAARALAWTALLRGVQLGEGTRDTRRRVRLSEIVPSGTSAETVRAAVRPFVRERLLTMGSEIDAPADAWLEITHEALITTWSALRERLAGARSAERLSRRAQEAGERWRGRQGDVWQGIDLVQLEDHARDHRLTEVQAAFLTASRRAARRRQLVNRAAVLLLAIVTLGAAGSAWWIADQNSREVAARLTAEQQTRSAQLQEARAASILARQATERGDAMTGMLAALHVMPDATRPDVRARSADAAMALLDAWSRHREVAAMIGHTDTVTSASFSADRKRVVTVSQDTTARVWDLTGVAPVATVLAGHTGGVWSASFSADGKRVVTASSDTTARVWDLTGAAPVATVLAGHTDTVYSASFSADGKRVVTASADNTARVWDLTGAAPVATVLAGHTRPVTSASFSADGNRVVTASADNTARVWDLAGPAPLATVLRGHTAQVTSASFSADGNRVVTASADNTARVWDLTGAAPVATVLRGHTGEVNTASFSADGRRVVTASADKTARVWDLTGPAPAATVLAGHTDTVYSASFSADGKRVVTASRDDTARVWDLTGAGPVATVLAGHTGPVTASFSADGKRVVTASRDKTARVWDLTDPAPVATVLAGHTKWLNSASFSADGKRVVTASRDHTARVWDLTRPAPVATVLAGHTDTVYSASFSADGKRVVTASRDDTARVWDLTGPVPIATVLAGHTNAVNTASFSADGKRVVTASHDKTARVWDLTRPAPVATVLAGHTEGVNSASFSADGNRVVTASRDNTARVWDLTGPVPIATVLAGHTNAVNTASFSADGKRVVTASWDTTARVWDLTGPAPVVTVLAGHTEGVNSASFSADGNRVVTASQDNTARVWDLTGAAPAATVLAGHTDLVTGASFSADGERVVTASNDNTARVWDLTGAAPVAAVLTGHTGPVTDASFSADGERVVTASADGGAISYPVPPDDKLMTLARRALTRCLTMEQREALGLPVEKRTDADRWLIRPPPC